MGHLVLWLSFSFKRQQKSPIWLSRDGMAYFSNNRHGIFEKPASEIIQKKVLFHEQKKVIARDNIIFLNEHAIISSGINRCLGSSGLNAGIFHWTYSFLQFVETLIKLVRKLQQRIDIHMFANPNSVQVNYMLVLYCFSLKIRMQNMRDCLFSRGMLFVLISKWNVNLCWIYDQWLVCRKETKIQFTASLCNQSNRNESRAFVLKIFWISQRQLKRNAKPVPYISSLKPLFFNRMDYVLCMRHVHHQLAIK